MTETDGTRERKTVAIDTETTGLGHVARPPRRDGVVQVGVAWRDAEGRMRSWRQTCNPGEALLAGGRADEALAVNGLSAAEVASAPPAAEVGRVLQEKLAAVGDASGAKVVLKAYNRAFDEPFLAAPAWIGNRFEWGPCIMQEATLRLDGPYGRWPRLVDAVRRLGLAWPDGAAHNAGVDARAALLVDEALTAWRGPRVLA